MFVRLQADLFDPGNEADAFMKLHADAGAFVTFTGTVRSTEEHPVEWLTLEHYPAMAQKQIERFAAEAVDRFSLADIGVIHRYGRLARGEPIVQVMAAAPHRQAAFEGANYVMDWLKTDAPFWKKETGPDGTNWVDARETDDTARDRWRK